jgi:hypothetical protein
MRLLDDGRHILHLAGEGSPRARQRGIALEARLFRSGRNAGTKRNPSASPWNMRAAASGTILGESPGFGQSAAAAASAATTERFAISSGGMECRA